LGGARETKIWSRGRTYQNERSLDEERKRELSGQIEIMKKQKRNSTERKKYEREKLDLLWQRQRKVDSHLRVDITQKKKKAHNREGLTLTERNSLKKKKEKGKGGGKSRPN